MSTDAAETTNRLLKVLIGVNLRSREKQLPLKMQIEMLSELGLQPKEIAEILGKTGTHINKELSGIRKASTKKK